MEASSLHLGHGVAGGRQSSSSGLRQNMPEFTHQTTYMTPRTQPVDIVIPAATPSPHEDHVLKVVQQPEIAKVAAPKEKGRSMSLIPALLSFTKYRFFCSSDATRPSPRCRALVQKPGVEQVRWSQLSQQSPYSFRQNLSEQPLFLRQCRADNSTSSTTYGAASIPISHDRWLAGFVAA
jgi:hypothetical protein